MTEHNFPQPEPDDADEVVLALSTGGSLWTSGDKTEAIRWLRKAQEAADAAGNDMRSLTLARAAADLADLAETGQAVQAATASEAAPTSADIKPQLTKPPMPPPTPKTRLETPRAKSQNGSSGAAAVLSAGQVVEGSNGQSGAATPSAEAIEHSGPILTQALRVCIKRSFRDDELLVARVLEDGEVPAGYQEALVVLTDPDQDLLDKLS
jgi:hypothetical protein